MLHKLLSSIREYFSSDTPKKPERPSFKQGDIVAKYESRNRPHAISTDPDDPGGVSYGLFQFSTHKGTLSTFTKYSKYSVLFEGLTPGTIAFDTQWVALCNSPEFIEEQREYAVKRYLLPILDYATKQGLQTHTTAMKEALFSIAIQHGGWKKILRMHKARIPAYKVSTDHLRRIESLYLARREYILSLSSLTPRLKNALVTRYRRELTSIFVVYHEQDSVVRLKA